MRWAEVGCRACAARDGGGAAGLMADGAALSYLLAAVSHAGASTGPEIGALIYTTAYKTRAASPRSPFGKSPVSPKLDVDG